MKKLSKDQSGKLVSLASDLRLKADEVTEATEKYNNEAGELRDDLAKVVDEYNELVNAAKDIVEEIASTGQDYMSERTEKWQEGDAGQAYQGWIDQFDGFDASEIEIEWPHEIRDPEMNHADSLDDLPHAPD